MHRPGDYTPSLTSLVTVLTLSNPQHGNLKDPLSHGISPVEASEGFSLGRGINILGRHTDLRATLAFRHFLLIRRVFDSRFGLGYSRFNIGGLRFFHLHHPYLSVGRLLNHPRYPSSTRPACKFGTTLSLMLFFIFLE